MSQSRSLLLRVVEVVTETADAVSVVLAPEAEHADWFAYRPGQFLTVHVPTDREGGAARCYSLCSSPYLDDKLKVTVKRSLDGYGSNWICDNVVAGSSLEVLRPAGTFTPDELDADFVLLAAGSGITPVMSIAKSALYAGHGKIILIYGNRDESSVIFRDELAALHAAFPERFQVVHWLESVQGLPTDTALRELVRPYADREAFICGPDPFMDSAVSALYAVGVPHERVHLERFTSLATDPFREPELVLDDSGKSGEIEVQLDGETRTLPWPGDNRLLDVLLDAGLDAPFSCREGRCSACACQLLEGEVAMDHNEVLEKEDLAEGYILACQSRPVTERVKITYDE